MRILMLDNELPPLGGGMGTANLALLKLFSQIPDMTIDVITSALGRHAEEEQYSERINIYKVPVWNQNVHHSSNRELSQYAVLSLFRAIKLLRTHTYDFCFAWSALPAGAVALILREIKQLGYMVWASGPDIPGFERRYQRLYPFLIPLIRRIWRSATPVIVKCQEEVDMIHAVEADLPVMMIPNGVDLNLFQPGSPTPDNGSLEVICSARLIERKGQHHLIEATKRLIDDGVDVTTRLLGTGDSLGDYKRLVNNLGVEECVRFMGYVPREEIPHHYAAAHVFALPSYNEGMSLAALEAMSSGLPLLLTRTGGTDNLVEEGVNGFTFDWSDVDTLAFHLRRLAEYRELTRYMGKKSRERAKQYSWDIIGKQYLELFKRMHAEVGFQ